MSAPEGSSVIFRHPVKDVRPLALRRFARRMEREVADGRAFDCLITGDAEMRRLNRDFRGKDYVTDVLSFPAAAGLRLGDLAISIQRARTQAREFGHAPEEEVRILMLHGLLHLLGLDHENGDPRMARREKAWRTRLGLPTGLIERAVVSAPSRSRLRYDAIRSRARRAPHKRAVKRSAS